MHSILHKLTIECSPEALYMAIAKQKGLAAWWTKSEIKEKSLRLFFGQQGENQVEMDITNTIENTQVKWKCTAGPWVDKGDFVFDISPDERGCCLRFSHHGWQETDDFYQHCNSKWGFFLVVSLKQYLETGTGLPHPNDPSI